MIKSPEQFLRSLKEGKFLPTDCILVKDLQGAEWIPLNDVHQFRIETTLGDFTESDVQTFTSESLFDRIRRPRFNFSALTLGGFWYLLNRMPHLALKRLLISAVLLASLLALGWILELPLVHIASLTLAGWFLTASISALRADHDLNRLHVEQYQKENQPPEELPTTVPDIGHQALDAWIDTPEDAVPTWKEKILN